MRNNHPVTNHEVEMRDDATLVSTTDLKGIITEVNPEFVAISGFSEQELIGKNHNIVRHPDMPEAAFKDLWDTVKSDHPWVVYRDKIFLMEPSYVNNHPDTNHTAAQITEEMVQVNTSAEEVNIRANAIAEIDAASTEQTTGIEQVNQATAQLDSNTQQNTAMVEESAAASQRLNDQASDLRQQISVFHFDDRSAGEPLKSDDKRVRKQVRAIVEAQSGSSSGAGQEQNRDDVWGTILGSVLRFF